MSVSAINFCLDDGRITNAPIGENALTLSAKISIIYANKAYIDLFNGILAGFNFTSVEYISDMLAQALYVIPREKREDLSLLVDVGDLTASIAFVKGDGLVGLTSFSRGGGFI